MHFLWRSALVCLSVTSLVRSIDLDAQDADSIKGAAKTVAEDIVNLYKSNHSATDPIGLFDDDYFWWESGATWDAFIEYWYLTGDDQFNDQVSENLLAQVGPKDDYLPPNQTKSEVCQFFFIAF
jgi:mannan endo-1,6-alpha-mannosidase